MTNPQIEAAFRKLIDDVDSTWRLVREDPLWRIDTLSSSLADPRENAIESVLRRACTVVQNLDDRAALISLAGAARAQGLISEPVLNRLIVDIEKP